MPGWIHIFIFSVHWCHFYMPFTKFRLQAGKKEKQKNEGTNVKELVDIVFIRCASVQRCRYPAVYLDVSVLKCLLRSPHMIFHQPWSPCSSGQKHISHRTLIWENCWHRYSTDLVFLFCIFVLSKCSLKVWCRFKLTLWITFPLSNP